MHTFTPCLATLSAGQVDLDALSEKLARHGIVLTMHVNETLAGFAAFYCNDTVTKQAFLSLLAVLPEYRQQKIGQKLLSAAIARAQQAHMDRFVLEVQRENLPAIAFYEKNRFSFTDKETVHSRFMMLPLNKQ